MSLMIFSLGNYFLFKNTDMFFIFLTVDRLLVNVLSVGFFGAVSSVYVANFNLLLIVKDINCVVNFYFENKSYNF